MINQNDTERVRKEVECLLAQGFFEQPNDRRVRVGEPLVVYSPDGSPHSWFVPLLMGAKLAGFAQLLPSLVMLRVSSFRRSPDAVDSCPNAADWVDRNRIRARAESVAREDEELSEPVLTFDKDPSRIAWRVLLTPASGQPRVLFIAASTAYEASDMHGLDFD